MIDDGDDYDDDDYVGDNYDDHVITLLQIGDGPHGDHHGGAVLRGALCPGLAHTQVNKAGALLQGHFTQGSLVTQEHRSGVPLVRGQCEQPRHAGAVQPAGRGHQGRVRQGAGRRGGLAFFTHSPI